MEVVTTVAGVAATAGVEDAAPGGDAMASKAGCFCLTTLCEG